MAEGYINKQLTIDKVTVTDTTTATGAIVFTTIPSSAIPIFARSSIPATICLIRNDNIVKICDANLNPVANTNITVAIYYIQPI